MKYGKLLTVFVIILLISLVAGSRHFAATRSKHFTVMTANPPLSPMPSGTQAKAPGTEEVDPQAVTDKVANFLGKLTPGGTPEAAGHERTYVVSYQVDFIRPAPTAKAPEESLSYKQLQAESGEWLPYIFYGETVMGRYDPAQPGVIAVRANIGGKEVKGYIDAAKLWLEPPLDLASSDRYMVVTETTSVHVVPDPASPPVLTLLQGEVVDAVGVLDYQGRGWVKARFNVPDLPRYGFIPASETKPLSVASVNQSDVGQEEVPKRMRGSVLKFSAADRKKLSQDGFYIEPLPPSKQVSVDDMADAYNDIGMQGSGEQFFITTDLFLHAYHLIFTDAPGLEEKKFLPAVTNFSIALAGATDREFQAAPASAAAYRNALLCDPLFFGGGEGFGSGVRGSCGRSVASREFCGAHQRRGRRAALCAELPRARQRRLHAIQSARTL